MSDILDVELENQIEEDLIEEVSDVQDMVDMIGLKEEMKRIKKQDKALEIPKEYINTEVFKVAVDEAYAISKAFRILMESGVDYSNALAMAQSSVIGYGNRELQKISNIQAQTQQI